MANKYLFQQRVVEGRADLFRRRERSSGGDPGLAETNGPRAGCRPMSKVFRLAPGLTSTKQKLPF
jgi:hypothetical protein